MTGNYTEQGMSLLTKLKTGASLNITRVTAGDSETPTTASSLIHDCQDLSVGSAKREGNTVVLPVTLLSSLAEQDYVLKELGIYAQDPDDGEILYCIYRADYAIPISSSCQMAIRFELSDTISESTEITVEGTAAGMVTEGDLKALMGAPNGLATLDEDAIVPVANMPYTFGTEDMEAGVTPMKEGHLYFMYEE